MATVLIANAVRAGTWATCASQVGEYTNVV